MDGKRIAMYSFGSGMCSSFYSITVHSGEKLNTLIDYLLQHVPVILQNRSCASPIEFETILGNNELYNNKGTIILNL